MRIPYRLAVAMSMTILAACAREGRSPRQIGTAVQQSRNAVSVATTERTPVALACLNADSLRLAGDSLVFSNQRVDDETGDLLGTSLNLVRHGATWGGTIALAQGEQPRPDSLRRIALDTITGDLSLDWGALDKPATFRGKVSCSSLIGEFRWAPEVDRELDTLPRSHRDTVAWHLTEQTTVAWRSGAPPYEVVFEESVPASTDRDPDHRIRVLVPGRPDFTVVDDQGPIPFLAVRVALDSGLVPRDLPDSARLLLLPAAKSTTPLLLAFAPGYASDANQLIVLGLDRTGYPVLLFRDEFDLEAVEDLDGDGLPELVGKASLSQGMGECVTTYDPYAVYRLGIEPGAKLQYDLALSEKYNLAHYVWAGPKADESLEVHGCPPAKRTVVRRQKRE